MSCHQLVYLQACVRPRSAARARNARGGWQPAVCGVSLSRRRRAEPVPGAASCALVPAGACGWRGAARRPLRREARAKRRRSEGSMPSLACAACARGLARQRRAYRAHPPAPGPHAAEWSMPRMLLRGGRGGPPPPPPPPPGAPGRPTGRPCRTAPVRGSSGCVRAAGAARVRRRARARRAARRRSVTLRAQQQSRSRTANIDRTLQAQRCHARARQRRDMHGRDSRALAACAARGRAHARR
jgi:hypothetical protein